MEAKYRLYLELNKRAKDPYGFQASHECDSLLFTGLSACNPDNPADLMAAYSKTTGQFHRRPIYSNKDCCGCWNPPKNQPSFLKRLYLAYKHKKELGWAASFKKYGKYKGGSTISRDMLLGLAYYCYYQKKPEIALKVIMGAAKSFGQMGKGDPFRTGIRPLLFITFCLILYKIGGRKYKFLKPLTLLSYFPASGKLSGYQSHLEVLHILLRRDIIGIGNKQKQALISYSQRQPQNPLFQYAVGRKDRAEAILMNNRLWPESRLPTSKERSEEWLIQRDNGKDWKPDSRKTKYHNGADFLFMHWLINKGNN